MSEPTAEFMVNAARPMRVQSQVEDLQIPRWRRQESKGDQCVEIFLAGVNGGQFLSNRDGARG